MPLTRLLRRSLGFIRRNVIARFLGLHFGFEKGGQGVLFAIHRNSDFIKLFENSAYDIRSYWQSALFRSRAQTQDALLARITALAHGLEKGLAFPNRKPVFGIKNVEQLVQYLKDFVGDPNCRPDPRISWALSNLKAWHEHHADKEAVEQTLLESCADILKRGNCEVGYESTIILEQEVVQKQATGDFRSLAFSRHSVRDFSQEPVSIELILDAVSIATRTPSACNRQPIRTLCLSKGEQMQSALQLQNGNRGFSERIDKLLIVTFDMRSYLEHHERHLGYVDAGMYTMSLIYALHHLGLGTCCLNWAVEKDVDHRLHESLEIPKHLAIACFIAVGNLPQKLKVAASNRHPVETVLEIRQGCGTQDFVNAGS
jgi:nitroreductase